MNNNIIVKLVSLTLKGIKNVSNGKITFEDYRHLLKGDFTFTHPVSGIYGQNGSGKTAIIEAIKLLRNLLMGEKLAKSDINYINYQEKELYLKSQFYLFLNDNHYLISYEFTLKDNQGECEIINEGLSYRFFDLQKEKFSANKYLFHMDNHKSINQQFNAYFDHDERLTLNVTSKILKSESLLFSQVSRALLKEKLGNSLLSELIDIFNYYGQMKMVIIGNEFLGNISLNKMMPINIYLEDDDDITFNNIYLNLLEPSTIKKNLYPYLKKALNEVDLLINAIIPHLHLEIGREQPLLMKDGEKGINFEVVTRREDHVVPLKYESEGIKKIISVTCALIACFNDESLLLAIDELDAGIHEYLLGELLDIFLDAKGQLIFTSHNLRPLEKLSSKDVIFTTTDKDQRYIHLNKVGEFTNLRDLYMRKLMLGEKDYLYHQTDNYLIKKALRKAAK